MGEGEWGRVMRSEEPAKGPVHLPLQRPWLQGPQRVLRPRVLSPRLGSICSCRDLRCRSEGPSSSCTASYATSNLVLVRKLLWAVWFDSSSPPHCPDLYTEDIGREASPPRNE